MYHVSIWGTDEHMINVHRNFVLFFICHCLFDAYSFESPVIPVVFLKVNRWHVNAQGVDEGIINGQYNFIYIFYLSLSFCHLFFLLFFVSCFFTRYMIMIYIPQ